MQFPRQLFYRFYRRVPDAARQIADKVPEYPVILHNVSGRASRKNNRYIPSSLLVHLFTLAPMICCNYAISI